MEWINYEQEKWHKQPLPPSRRYVLCQIAAKPEKGLPPAVAVGYLRFAAGDPHSPVFTIPGVGGVVVAWCDCLGDDFHTFFKPKDTNHENHGNSDGYGPWDHDRM